MRQPVMNFSGELSPSEAAVATAAVDGGSTARNQFSAISTTVSSLRQTPL